MILEKVNEPIDFDEDNKYYIQVNDEVYEMKEVDDVKPDKTLADEMVNHPSHYRHGKVECIDCIASIVNMYNGEDAYLAGVVIKYLYRANSKGSYIQDLRKAQWYLNRLVKKAEKRFKQY